MHLPKTYLWLIAGLAFTTLSMSANAAKGGGKPPPPPAGTTLDTLGCTGDGEVAKFDIGTGDWVCADDNDSPVSVFDPVIVELIARIEALENQLEPCVNVRYADQGDGTVLDCNTGVVWLRDASCANLGFERFGVVGIATFDEANSTVASLSSGTCGLSDGSKVGDWQLPTVGQFCSRDVPSPIGGTCPSDNASDSLINSGESAPMVNKPNPFVRIEVGNYWSSTEDGTSFAWSVILGDGDVYSFSKSNSYYAWPVRVGQ